MKTEEVLLSEDIFRDYKSSDRATWSDNFIEDREFRLGEQFSEEIKTFYQNQGMMTAPVNETLPATDQIISDLTANDPRFYAVGIEDSDYKVASYVADLFHWIWYISKGRVKIERFTRDFCEGGVGVLMVYPDYFADNGNGELKIIDIDPLEVYIDPACKEPDGSDSAHILISKLMTEEMIEDNYPGFDFNNAEQESGSDYHRQRSETQGQIIFAGKITRLKEYRSIERFTKVKITRYYIEEVDGNFSRIFEDKKELEAWKEEPTVILTRINQPDYYAVEPAEIEELLTIYNNYGDTYHIMKDQNGFDQIVAGVETDSPYAIQGSTTKIQLVTKAQLIEDGVVQYSEPKAPRIKRVLSIGGKELVNEILPIKDYPIVTGMLHHNRNPYACGDIRVIKPLQEQLNILDMRIQSYLRTISTLRVFVSTDSGLKKVIQQEGDPLGIVAYEYNMDEEHSPLFPQFPPLPAGIFQQRENIIRQIQRIIGAYSFQDGEATATPRTLGGTDRIDEFMRRRSAYKKRKIEASLDQLAKAIAQYIPYIYTTRKAIRILSPNHDQVQTVINEPTQENGQIKLLNNVTNLEFDVQVISGSTLPTNRAQEREELLRAYEIGAVKNPIWWLKKANFDNIDEIIESENLVNQLQGAVGQLQEQIKDLEGQLQTKVREVIQANEKVLEEKTKTKLEKLVSKLEATVQLTQQRLNDKTKEKGDTDGQ